MELAQRVNYAYMLLKRGTPPLEILEALIKQYGVSRIQAYWYIRLAKAGQGPMLILEPSVVFTVNGTQPDKTGESSSIFDEFINQQTCIVSI